MLTRNLTNLPVQVGVSVPSSPAAISPDISLADLKAIKAFWTMGAREQSFPEKIYNVTNCLGKEVITHNHPSGDCTPSPDDVAVTRAMVQAGKLLDTNLLDHLIIGNGKFVSLKERGLGFS